MMSQEFNSDIAIIGMSGRFPGADTISQFYDNLLAGRESISIFSSKELLEENVPKELLERADYVPAKGIVNDVEWFDAAYFNITPLEATILDPQQRLLLECAVEAFENAGYVPDTFQDRVGVFVSGSLSHYLIKNILPNINQLSGCDEYQILLGNDKDFLATRISHKLNLRGPSLTIQTACSSSLVCIHTACQSILNGECEMALAGGVSITLPQKEGYVYKKDMIASKDGHCYPFDERAQGTVKGNGLGLVLLKPLQEAVKDHDLIYAVIKGSAINNDGAHKMAYTAPSVEQQAAVIQEALLIANVTTETIDYIETHGTGTELGDPVEIAALSRVFKNGNKSKPCAIGSLKANIGHLDTAAGVAGLIKLALALKNKKIPASINFTKPNPKLALDQTPFYINTQLKDWQKIEGKRRGGLSAFGVGGTNVHMILEEAPLMNRHVHFYSNYHLLPISAKNPESLKTNIQQLIYFLNSASELNIADVAYTLQTGRHAHALRFFIIAANLKDAVEKFEDVLMHGISSSKKIFDVDDVYYTHGQTWEKGGHVNWDELYPTSKPYKVALPTYAWQKKCYWINAQSDALETAVEMQSEHSVSLDGMALLWQKVLGIDTVNLDDNFFELGGSSLTAIQLIHQLSPQLQQLVSVITLYEYPTLSALIQYIKNHQHQSSEIKREEDILESELFSKGEIL